MVHLSTVDLTSYNLFCATRGKRCPPSELKTRERFPSCELHTLLQHLEWLSGRFFAQSKFSRNCQAARQW